MCSNASGFDTVIPMIRPRLYFLTMGIELTTGITHYDKFIYFFFFVYFSFLFLLYYKATISNPLAMTFLIFNMSPHKRSVNEGTIHKDIGNYRFAQWWTVYTCKAQPVFKVTFEKRHGMSKIKSFLYTYFSLIASNI